MKVVFGFLILMKKTSLLLALPLLLPLPLAAPAPAPASDLDPDFQTYMRKEWSDASIKRLCNFAQCKRIRADSYDTIRAALYSITSRICEKSFYIATKIDKVKTLLPRQIEFVCKSTYENRMP